MYKNKSPKPIGQFLFEDVTVYLSLALVSLLAIMQLPKVLDKERAFNENIRKARCERNYLAGYCKGIEEKDWLTQLAEKEGR